MGQKIKLWSNGEQFDVEGLGYQSPKAIPSPELAAGEVGYIYANIKNVGDAKSATPSPMRMNPAAEALPGFEEIKPMVFAGLYPVESHEHGLLRDALEKLRLNDSAMSFEPENSVALGFRLPLRIPWPAASRDRAGAAGARVQYRPDHDRAGRSLPHYEHKE